MKYLLLLSESVGRTSVFTLHSQLTVPSITQSQVPQSAAHHTVDKEALFENNKDLNVLAGCATASSLPHHVKSSQG